MVQISATLASTSLQGLQVVLWLASSTAQHSAEMQPTCLPHLNSVLHSPQDHGSSYLFPGIHLTVGF